MWDGSRKRIVIKVKNRKIGEGREVEIIKRTSQAKVCKAQVGDASRIVTSDSNPVNAWATADPRRKERLALVVKTCFPFEKSLSFFNITSSNFGVGSTSSRTKYRSFRGSVISKNKERREVEHVKEHEDQDGEKD